MSNLHRVMWIDAQVRAGRYPNCRSIADRFEVSRRQAARDIEYLRYSLGAPLEFCPQRNGYRYADGAFALPPHYLSDDERQALARLAGEYRQAGGGPAAVANLLARLSTARPAAGRSGAGTEAGAVTTPLDPFTARVLFSDPPVHPFPEAVPISHGLYDITFRSSSDLYGRLVSYCPRFTVESPAWLKARIGEWAIALVHRHGGWDNIRPTPSPILRASDRKEAGMMGERVLEGLKVERCWTSFAGAMAGVLRHMGWWHGEMWEFMGLTGMAFRFIVHEAACPSSVTVYDWRDEHFAALDRLGIHTEVHQVTDDPGLNTMRLVREAAVERIKRSIDAGRGVVAWTPTPLLEFGLIRGYSDKDSVFFVEECTGKQADPLLYSNLGRSEVPILYYQTVHSRVPVEPDKAHRSALAYAVAEWRGQHMNPRYAKGGQGYRNLAATLERRDFDPFGLGYILAVYHQSKDFASRYLRMLAGGGFGLDTGEAAGHYSRVASLWARMTAMVPCQGPDSSVDPGRVSALLAMVEEAHAMEEQGVKSIEQALS